jgi:hypothetical protein
MLDSRYLLTNREVDSGVEVISNPSAYPGTTPFSVGKHTIYQDF